VPSALPAGVMVVDSKIARNRPESGRAARAGARPVLWPLFSPRSARLAAAALAEVGTGIGGVRAPVAPLAISEAAVAAFGNWPTPIPVAPTPDAEGLIALIRGWLVARAGGR